MKQTEVEAPWLSELFPVPNVKVVGRCGSCEDKLLSDEVFIKKGEQLFCDESCLKNHLGYEWIEGWELNE